MYHLPHYEDLPEVEITAITMRGDRPIYRNHQTYAGYRSPAVAAAVSRGGAVQPADRDRPQREGRALPDLGRGALLHPAVRLSARRLRQRRADAAMGAPWLNTKLVVAVSPDTDLDDPGDVYHAIATRCDPARDIIIVGNTRGSPYDPSASRSKGSIPGGPSARWASMPPSSRGTIPPISNAPGRATGAR